MGPLPRLCLSLRALEPTTQSNPGFDASTTAMQAPFSERDKLSVSDSILGLCGAKGERPLVCFGLD